jgi:E3 ubiquitin-protein ligase synoviolin
VNPLLTRATYARILALLLLLLAVDGLFLHTAVTTTLERGPSMMMLFGFEYALVAWSLLATVVKFGFNLWDVHLDGRWENKGTPVIICLIAIRKFCSVFLFSLTLLGMVVRCVNAVWFFFFAGMYVLYLDFVFDFLRLLVSAVFFTLVFQFYGLPLHLVRQTWSTFRSFRKSLLAVTRYRRATLNMNERYTRQAVTDFTSDGFLWRTTLDGSFPDATAEDIRRFDPTCIVCRDEMTTGKKLPCGHILHVHCLRRWLERSQNCPICTQTVFREDSEQQRTHPLLLYFHFHFHFHFFFFFFFFFSSFESIFVTVTVSWV